MARLNTTRALLVIENPDGSRITCEINPCEVTIPAAQIDVMDFGPDVSFTPLETRIEARGPLVRSVHDLAQQPSLTALAVKILRGNPFASEAQQLALAVLNGDQDAALMLADLIQERHISAQNDGRTGV